MSSADAFELDPAVRPELVETSRGTFATLVSRPTNRPVPRGDALLLPGFTGSKEDFAVLLPLLSRAGWSVASYDQRGQFETPGAPDDDYTLDGFAMDAEAVSDAVFGVAEPVHLVGHSFGGLVATTAALREPSRWASLVLLCSGPGGVPSGRIADEARWLADAVPRDGLESVYQAKHARDTDQGRVRYPPSFERFNQKRFLTSSPDSLVAIAALLAGAPDRTSELAALGLPVGVLRGAEDTWPHVTQDALADALDTHVEEIAGAAHSPAVEQPEATRDALARIWLR